MGGASDGYKYVLVGLADLSPPKKTKRKRKVLGVRRRNFFLWSRTLQPRPRGFLPGGGWFEGGWHVGFSVTPYHYHWAVGISLRLVKTGLCFQLGAVEEHRRFYS